MYGDLADVTAVLRYWLWGSVVAELILGYSYTRREMYV